MNCSYIRTCLLDWAVPRMVALLPSCFSASESTAAVCLVRDFCDLSIRALRNSVRNMRVVVRSNHVTRIVRRLLPLAVWRGWFIRPAPFPFTKHTINLFSESRKNYIAFLDA